MTIFRIGSAFLMVIHLISAGIIANIGIQYNVSTVYFEHITKLNLHQLQIWYKCNVYDLIYSFYYNYHIFFTCIFMLFYSN